jgi:hypothetical protein
MYPEHSSNAKRAIILIGSLFLASGAALLAYIGSGISMSITLLIVVILFTIVGRTFWKRLPNDRQAFLRSRIQAGIKAGLIATLAYDGCRLLLIKLTGIHFWPFDIFRIFGRALVGNNLDPFLTQSLGLGFHVLNGVAFSVAYTIWWGNKGILWGIGFAFALEFLMVSVYPGWLGMKALDEFLQVSIFGHFVYGIALGYFAKKWSAS